MAKELISAKKIAERWGVTGRRINQLCNAKEIKGAIKVGGRWKIPFDVEKPSILRSSRPKIVLITGNCSPARLASLPIKRFPSNAITLTKRCS